MISKTGCFMTYWENNRCLLELSKGLSADCSTNEPKKRKTSEIPNVWNLKTFLYALYWGLFAVQPQYWTGWLSDQADLVALNHLAQIDEGIAHTSQCGIDAYSFLFCNLAEREVFIKTKEYNLLLVFWQVGEHLF